MKVLIIGLGSIGQRHARNLRLLLGSELQLFALRARRLKHVITQQLALDESRNVEEELDIRAFTALGDALKEKPDAAFICTPSGMHLQPARAAANAGCDLFIEKPLSSSLDGIDDLIDEVAHRNIVAAVGYQLRFHPCIAMVAEALRSEVVGQPLSVRATVGEFMPNFHRYEDYRATYPAQRKLGGGVILSQIHEFDYLYSLFGKPKRIFALGGHWSPLEIDVEDTASILMECETAGRPLPVHLHQDFLQNPPQRNCEIITNNGRIFLDLVALAVEIRNRETGEVTKRSFAGLDRNQLFLDEVRHFLSCVKKRQEPLVNLCEGAQSLHMALAAKQSIEQKRIMELSSQGTYS